MEEAAIHAADGLSNDPLLLLVAVLIVVLAGVSIYVARMWNEHRRQQLASDSEFRTKQLDIERDRELRKMEESKQRNEREKENAILMRASIEAQERSTIAINESTAQMAALMAKLEVSQQGSAAMLEKVDDMSVEVHDIHLAVVK